MMFYKRFIPLVGLLLFAADAGARCRHRDHDEDDEARQCRDVDGDFSSDLFGGPDCKSPLGMCTHGVLTGDLEGTYDFTFLTMTPDPNDPGLTHYTGTSEIHFGHKGKHVLYGQDHGFLRTMNGVDATFETTVVIQSGNHELKNASGSLVAAGQLSFITGHATGTYDGDICRR